MGEGRKPEEFGQRLRSLRKAAGLTQKELAGSRFSPAYISSIESGRRSPSASALIYLSERLRTDLSAILFPGGSELSEALQHLPATGPEAARILREIIRSVERARDPLLRADVLRVVGESLLLDTPDTAEALLYEALEIYRARPEGSRGLGRTLFLLGEFAVERGESGQALELYREAAGLFVN